MLSRVCNQQVQGAIVEKKHNFYRDLCLFDILSILPAT
jgi:hypothetical protein